MIVNWLRADMFEHSNRHEPQPDSIERVNEAEGDALRFNALLVEYLRALEVTRRRNYLETSLIGRHKSANGKRLDRVKHMHRHLTAEA